MNLGTLLFVDDIEEMRELAAEVLVGAGFKVLTASGGDAALSLVESANLPIDVLITDLKLEGMSGTELADRIRSEHSGIRVLLISGSPDRGAASALKEGPGAFLQKPFTAKELISAVRNLVDLPQGPAK